jgi:plasmid stabilization system protein ParE
MAYIAEDNPGAAAKTGSTIYSKIEKLADFPEMGAHLSAKISTKTEYRFLVCGVYLVFYKIEGEFVSVYRVLNGVRDYLSILFSDEVPKD